jgi:hypothetical protein
MDEGLAGLAAGYGFTEAAAALGSGGDPGP